MHDYFQILGVAPDARASDIRAACARHSARPHTDLFEAAQRQDEGLSETGGGVVAQHGLVDVAIDFPDLSAATDRMLLAFFRSPR